MTKHNYTNADHPTNTGSLTRPARLNLRLDCSTWARTHKVFGELREMLGLPKHYSYADVWQYAALLALEHTVWHLKESPTAMKTLVRSLYDRLPKEDWVRSRYAELKARLDPKPKSAGSGGVPSPRQSTFFDGDDL